MPLCLPSGRAARKSRILHEMLYADLGIKDIRITGSKEEPIISALHTLDTGDGTSKGFWLPLRQEPLKHSGSFLASVCGSLLWNLGLFWW